MIQPPIVLIALCGFLRDGRSKLALLAQQPLPGVVIEKADVATTLLQLLDNSSSGFCAHHGRGPRLLRRFPYL